MAKICPFYVVNDQDEFDRAVSILGGNKGTECLHKFPMIVGREVGFGIIQCKPNPMPPYEDLVYEQRTLPNP